MESQKQSPRVDMIEDESIHIPAWTEVGQAHVPRKSSQWWSDKVASLSAPANGPTATGTPMLQNLHDRLEALALQMEHGFCKMDLEFSSLKQILKGARSSPQPEPDPEGGSGGMAAVLRQVDNLPYALKSISGSVTSLHDVLQKIELSNEEQQKNHMQSVLQMQASFDLLCESVRSAPKEPWTTSRPSPRSADQIQELEPHLKTMSYLRQVLADASNACHSISKLRQQYKELMEGISKKCDKDIIGHALTTTHGSSKESRLLKIVHGDMFNATSSLVIIVNTIMLGIQANIEVVNAIKGDKEELPVWFRGSNLALLCIFSTELVIRLVAEKITFFIGEFRGWNLFDTCLVIAGIVEEAFAASTSNLSFFRVVKIGRMTRAVRMLRVFRYVRELRVMTHSILSSFISLGWAFVLIGLLIYCCAVTFCLGVADYISTEPVIHDGVYDALHDFYRSVPIAMYSLVLAISGGKDWYDLISPLSYVGPFHFAAFILYTLFVIFGMLNVLTGVFVERASELAQMDRDLAVEGQKGKHEDFSMIMRSIFEEADRDHSGQLSWPEFKAYCENEDVRDYFASIDLRIEESKELFHMLDSSGTGLVDIDQFISACLRLTGNAKSFDLFHIQEDVREVKKLVSLIGDQNDNLFEILGAHVATLKSFRDNI